MKTALIISGGDFCSLPDALKFDICIACDKGYIYAQKYGITPTVILGDFDSADRPEQYDIPLLTYPVEKDDTDTMLAVKYALEEECDHVFIACALGKRLDHTLANIQSLAYIANRGASGEIISDSEHLQTIIGGTVELPKRDGYSLSVFSLTDSCDGVSISGAKYDVVDAVITNIFPIGCSNEWRLDTVTISVKNGILLVVESLME